MTTLTRSLHLLSLLAAAAGLAVTEPPAPRPAATSNATPTKQPVLLELFTSEGCSSCPPADELLEKLAKASTNQRPVIALAFHVDYWDRLGWKDPFASPEFTARQERYSKALNGRGLYTPQLVVGGSADAVGSDSRAIGALIDEQTKASATKSDIELTIVEPKPAPNPQQASKDAPPAPKPAALEHIIAKLLLKDLPKDAAINIVLTQSDITTNVPRGENAGRSLKHSHVVRQLLTTTPSKDATAQGDLTLPAGVARSSLRVVAFAQDARSLKVLAAREVELPAATATLAAPPPEPAKKP